MTKSEAIEQLKFLNKVDFHIDTKESCDIAISELEENDKLKAEIEQLKERLEIKDNKFELYSNALDEVKKLQNEADELKSKIVTLNYENSELKSELEQSVIQCTHGYDKRQNEIGETLIFL